MLSTLANYCSGQKVRISLQPTENINDSIKGFVGTDFIIDIPNNTLIWKNTKYINPDLIILVEKL